MGITIPAERLELVLEQAVTRAESGDPLPQLWLERAQHMGDCPSQTYVAALGTALLAKAADPRIDTLSVKSKAGPNAYSMRGVAKVLVQKAPLYGYHLGRKGPEPLNNQPWFGVDRVDRVEGVRADALSFHRDMVRYLTELGNVTPDEALAALAAFIRVRQKAEQDEREAVSNIAAGASGGIGELIEMVTIFLRQDSENGRRAQALTAAALDLVYDDVHLGTVNDPTALDVSVGEKDAVQLAVEVKDKSVVEATARHLAEEARDCGADKALLVAVAQDQRPLNRELIRRECLRELNVLVEVVETVAELLAYAALAASTSAEAFASGLPAAYLRRMQQHRVSLAGQQYWSDLCARL